MRAGERSRSLLRAWRLARKPVDALGASAPILPGPLVVSLASVPSRLVRAHLAVRSLLDQSVRPEIVVLWLGDEVRGKVPESLAEVLSDRLEIRYRADAGPQTRLVHALQEFPDHAIATFTDRHLYAGNCLERLWAAHVAHPDEVVAHECRRISRRPDGSLRPADEWPPEEPGESHGDTVALGYAGVLYPPDTLHADTTDHRLYRELAPRDDDLWFKAMSLLFGTRTRRSPDPPRRPLPSPGLAGRQEDQRGVPTVADGKAWERLAAHYGFPLGG